METHAERAGYYKLDMGDFDEAPGEEIEDGDVECRAGGIGRLMCGALNVFLRDLVRDRLRAQLANVGSQVRDALAEQATDPTLCPAGTHVEGTHCAFGDGTAVPALLGAEGELAPLQPGSQPLRFVLAAGDPYASVNVGSGAMVLDAMGALYASNHASCVPRLDAPRPLMLPESSTLRSSDMHGADVSIAVGEDFVNAALFGVWDSGALCIERDSANGQQLANAIGSALAPNDPLRAIVAPAGASIAVAIHPQRPPRITVSADPVSPLHFELPQISVEFTDATGHRLLQVTTDASATATVTWSGNAVHAAVQHVTLANTQASGANVPPDAFRALERAVSAQLAPLINHQIDAILPTALPTIALPALAPGASTGGVLAVVPTQGSVQSIVEGNTRFLTLGASLRYQPPGH